MLGISTLQKMLIVGTSLLLMLLSTACAESIGEAVVIPGTEVESVADANGDSDEGDNSDAHPVGWSEESHGNGVDPNYDVVFPEDQVNQITITIAPDDWEAMQANMVDLFGESGTGTGADRQPDQFRQPGEQGPPDGFAPPQGDYSRPGGEGFPEGAEPPEGGFQRPGDGELPEGVQPPADGELTDQGLLPGEGGLPAEGRPADGERPAMPEGFAQGDRGGGQPGRGGDMTPENPEWVPATIEFEGNTWTHVGFRYKGNSSLTSGWRSGELKLPLKLDFDEFEDEYPEIKNQRFYGFKQLSLANGFSDASFLRDAATSDILQEAGLPAAETAFYEVVLDYGEGPVTLGLYTVIEVVDDTVVDRYFGSDDGNVYEGEGAAASFAASTYDQIEECFEKENNEDEADWSDIEALFEVLQSDERTSDPAAWRAKLEAIFDVDAFLEWLAISAIIEHWDAYGNMSHNYYLYDDPATGQLTWISWDHNMAMSTGMGGRGPGGQGVSLDKAEINDTWPLIRFLLDDPVYYERYLDYLAETAEGPFEADHMAEKYQEMAQLIAPYAAADVGEQAFETAVEQLIDHAYERADAVAAFLATTGRDIE